MNGELTLLYVMKDVSASPHVFSKSIKTDIDVLLAWLNTSSLISIAQLKFTKVLQLNKPSKPEYPIHWELC